MSKSRKRIYFISVIIIILILIAVMFTAYRPQIFQKGNPLPYIKGMLQLNNKTYVQIQKDTPIIFITKRDNYADLHKYIENNYNVSFDEQMGGGYFFRSEEKVVIASSEIYWRYFFVWTVSIN